MLTMPTILYMRDILKRFKKKHHRKKFKLNITLNDLTPNGSFRDHHFDLKEPVLIRIIRTLETVAVHVKDLDNVGVRIIKILIII